MEYTSIIGLIKRAESTWGGLYTVSGAAACFPTSVLRRVGGWSGDSITEDIEISWRIQKAGYQLAYEPRAIFHIQCPTRLGALYRQRRRWAQGMAEVLRLHGNLLRTNNPALLPILSLLLAALTWVGLISLAILQTVWWWFRGDSPLGLFATVHGSTLLTVGAWTMGFFLAQTLSACTFDSHYTPRSFRLFPLALLHPIYYWTIIFPCFVWGFCRGLFSRSSGRWSRTARTAIPETAPPGAFPGGGRNSLHF